MMVSNEGQQVLRLVTYCMLLMISVIELSGFGFDRAFRQVPDL